MSIYAVIQEDVHHWWATESKNGHQNGALK